MKIKLLILFMMTGTAFGDSKVFIFRPSGVSSKQIGVVNVDKTILIKYGLEFQSNSKSRFIALDSRNSKINPKLKTNEGSATGFLIVTSQQPVISVVISSRLMDKVRSGVERNVSAKEVVARSANLGVEFTRDKGKLIISRVILK